MAGVVRGRVEMDAPALRDLKELEKQGIRTEAQLKRVGRELDRVSKAWVEQTRIVKREVNAQQRAIHELELSLDKLNMKRANPTVNVDGIAEALSQVELLHSRLNALGRERVTPQVSGGGIGGGFLGGGGGAGRGGGGMFDLGMRGVRPRNALYGLLAAYAQPIIGASTAVVGSGALGLAGAGAVGAAGGLGAGVGIGSTIAVAKGLSGPIGEAKKAQDAYNQSLAVYGRNSAQARTSKLKLDAAFAAAPGGTRDLLRNYSGMQGNWQSATAPGRESLMGGANVALQAGARLLPFAARAANRSSAATAREGGNFANFLSGRTGQRALSVGSGIYDDNLGNTRQAVQYGLEAFVNIAQAARPYLREFTEFLKDWARGWSVPTRDIRRQREEIGKLVDHLRDWGRLGGAGMRLIKDILTAGAPSGRTAVQDFTVTLERWDAFIKSHPREVQDFFRRSVDSAEKLAGAIGEIVQLFSELSTMFGPMLDHFSQLVGLAASLGPALGPLLIGGRGAYRATRGGAGAGGGGGAGGFMPVPFGGGAGGGAGAGAGRPMGAIGAGVAAYGVSRAYGGSGRTGRLGPASRVSAARTGAGVTAGRAGGALRVAGAGAARAYAPVALAFGALDAYGTQGTIDERFFAGVSGATAGIIPSIGTGAAARSKGGRRAEDWLSDLPGATSVGGMAENQEAIRRRIAQLRGTETTDNWMTQDIPASLGLWGKKKPYTREVQGEIEALTDSYRQQASVIRQLRKDHRAQLENDERRRGAAFGERLGTAASRYRRRGFSQERVNEEILGTVQGSLGRQRTGAGVESVGEEGLAFLQKNGGTESQMRQMRRAIRSQFKALGKDIRIINGDILTGSREDWNKISAAISDPAFDALSKTGQAFRKIREMAIGQLESMGYSKREAKSIFRQIDKNPSTSINEASKNYNQSKLDRGTPGGAYLDALPTDPGRKKGQGDGVGDGPGRGKRGGAGGGSPSLMGASSALSPYAQLASSFGLSVSSGLRRGAVTSSGNTSFHASGNALDFSGTPSQMMAFARAMRERYGSGLEELIYTPMGGGQIKNGKPFVYGGKVASDHHDHVHVADTSPTGARGMTGGAPGAGTGGRGVSLNAPKSGLKGAAGAMADGASSLYAGALSGKLNSMLGGGGGGGRAHGGSGKYDAQELADLWRQAGGPSGKAQLMAAIALAESNGDPNVVNSIGATGLWQIHPGGSQYKDPMTNARTAVSKFKTQGLGAWEAYTNGAYRRYYGSGDGIGDGIGLPHGSGRMGAISRAPLHRRPATRRVNVGGGGVSVAVSMGSVHVRSEADIDAIAERVGQKVLTAMEGNVD